MNSVNMWAGGRYNMKILFENARILTLDEADHEYINGSLLVENGKIGYVGPGKAFDAVDRRVDARGDVLMPGFANAHTCLLYTSRCV